MLCTCITERIGMNIGETLVMTNQTPSQPIHTGSLTRRLMPNIKSEYERLWDELGGPADIGAPIKWPWPTLGAYCGKYNSNTIVPVLLKFEPDKSSARRHWPWAAFAISHYVFEQKQQDKYAENRAPRKSKRCSRRSRTPRKN
jgi:hypothetical protein